MSMGSLQYGPVGKKATLGVAPNIRLIKTPTSYTPRIDIVQYQYQSLSLLPFKSNKTLESTTKHDNIESILRNLTALLQSVVTIFLIVAVFRRVFPYYKVGLSMLRLLCGVLLVLLLTQQCMTLDLSLTIDVANILSSVVSHIGVDDLGFYWISLNQPSIIRVSDDFTTNTSIALTQNPDQYALHHSVVTAVLSNGTLIPIDHKVASVIQKSRTEIQMINYSDNTLQQLHSLGGKTIIAQQSGAISVSGVLHAYSASLVFDELIWSFQGHVQPIQPEPNIAADIVAACFARQTYVVSPEVLTPVVYFVASTAEPKVYMIQMQNSLTFDYFTNHFQTDQIIANQADILTPSGTIIFLDQAGDLVYMQDSSFAVSYVLNLQNNMINQVDSSVPQVQSFRFLQHNGVYYLMQADGLVKLAYDSVTNLMSLDQVASTLPANIYDLTVGQNTSVLYRPGNQVIYPQIQVTPSATLASQQNNSLFVSFISNLLGLSNTLIGSLEQGGSIPGGRRFISPLFYFFGVYDDLFLYQFHDREYGDTMNIIFEQIANIEHKKWSLFTYQNILQLLGSNTSNYKSLTQYQQSYLTYSFSSKDHTDVGSEGLIANCHNFFLVALPSTIMAFLGCKLIFNMTFQHRFSQLFRKFDFFAFLFILLFDGNVQQFSFYLSGQFVNLFFFKNILVFGGLLVVGSCSFYMMCFSYYGKLNRKLMDNNHNQITGHLLLIIQIGFRNLLLGVLHSMLRRIEYERMLAILIAVDALFLVLFSVSVSGRVYKQRLKMWIFIIIDFLKILLTCTFFADYQSINTVIVETTQQIILLAQFIAFVFGVLIETVNVVIDGYDIAKRIFGSQESESINKIQGQYIDELKPVLEWPFKSRQQTCIEAQKPRRRKEQNQTVSKNQMMSVPKVGIYETSRSIRDKQHKIKWATKRLQVDRTLSCPNQQQEQYPQVSRAGYKEKMENKMDKREKQDRRNKPYKQKKSMKNREKKAQTLNEIKPQ